MAKLDGLMATPAADWPHRSRPFACLITDDAFRPPNDLLPTSKSEPRIGKVATPISEPAAAPAPANLANLFAMCLQFYMRMRT